MTSRQLVLAYLAAVVEVATALRQTAPWIGRVGSPGMLMVKTAAGEYLREGDLPGVGHFTLHGIGCLVELHDGGLVDFDWDAGGCETFDPYRIRRYARSLGVTDSTDREILEVCASLAAEGVLVEITPGRFYRAG